MTAAVASSVTAAWRFSQDLGFFGPNLASWLLFLLLSKILAFYPVVLFYIFFTCKIHFSRKSICYTVLKMHEIEYSF
jgi:hypothetical protein